MRSTKKLLMVSAIVLALALSVSGCQKADNASDNANNNTVSQTQGDGTADKAAENKADEAIVGAEAVVTEFMDTFKSGKLDELHKYTTDDESDSDDMEEFMKDSSLFVEALTKNVSYKIKGSEKKADDAVDVTLEVTNVDMKEVFPAFMQAYVGYYMEAAMSGEEPTEEQMTEKVSQIFSESVESVNGKTVTNECTFNVIKTDDGWKIDMPDDDDETQDVVMNALMGDLGKASDAMENYDGEETAEDEAAADEAPAEEAQNEAQN